jgi:hypothetical protein
MTAPQGIATASVRTAPHQHAHGAEEHCPLCDQLIPPEKFDEIHGRIQAKERERALEAERRLKEQVALERALADAKAKAELEQIRKESAATLEKARQEAIVKETAAREEARRAAEAEAASKISEAEKGKKAAEQQAKEHHEALEKTKQEVTAREAAAREEARKAAEAAAAAKIAEAEQAKKLAEQQAKDQRVASEKIKHEAVAKEAAAREEARKAVEAALQPKLAEAEQARKTAEQQLQAAKVEQENMLTQRLKEQREALEKAGVEALNAERAKAFNEKLKVEQKLQEAQRQLQQKTAEELGEGAELDLFEALRDEFPDDKISRVDKGVAGPDIVHNVIHNGRICGCIIYDSKNRNQWRYDYATKLRQEQLAVNADHAILSTHVFPAGARQIHIHDGVLIANPARVLVLVELLRRQIVQTYGLRLSNEAREKKTNQLYEFITSDHATQLLDHIEARAEDMLELDVKEQKSHAATWKTRGQLVRAVQRARADFTSQIDRIIGTVADDGQE